MEKQDEKEFILKDQNSIYLDKNIPHAVIQNITPRLSCTISYY